MIKQLEEGTAYLYKRNHPDGDVKWYWDRDHIFKQNNDIAVCRAANKKYATIEEWVKNAIGSSEGDIWQINMGNI